MMRPPAVPPNWLRFKVSRTSVPSVRPLRSPLRRNSKISPWKALAPDLVTMLTTPPGCNPYCAGSPLVCTLNSCTASGNGMGRLTLLKASLLSPPSSRKFTPLAAPPATETWTEPPLGPWMFLLTISGIAIQGHVRGGDAGDGQQAGEVAPVERQIHDPLLFDDLGNRRIPGLHHAGARLHLHRLGQRAHLQGDVLREVFRHLQNDADLRVPLEAVRRNLQAIRSHRQVVKRVVAFRVGVPRMDGSPLGFRHFHGRVRARAAALIRNRAADAADCHGLSKNGRGRQKDQH